MNIGTPPSLTIDLVCNFLLFGTSLILYFSPKAFVSGIKTKVPKKLTIKINKRIYSSPDKSMFGKLNQFNL